MHRGQSVSERAAAAGFVWGRELTVGGWAHRIASLTVEGFEDSRRLPAAWECDEESEISQQSEQEELVLEISEEDLLQVTAALEKHPVKRILIAAIVAPDMIT